MGIAFSHCTASWSYGGFNRFREALAEEIGLDLNEMEGFGGTRPWKEIDDPIVALLNHTDTEGELTPEECERIWPRLRGLVLEWPEGYDFDNAIKLAAGMRLAALKGEQLKFQ